MKKNTIRDGGSTALYAAYTVDTFDTVDMVYTVYTVYTIQTALHCFNSSIYALVIGKVKTLLEWADGLLSKEGFG